MRAPLAHALGVRSASMTDFNAAAARPIARFCPPPFQEVFVSHGRFVWRTLRYLGVAEADLEDVCQEVFLVVHRRLPEFEGRSSIRTWVYGIALRVAADYRKRARTVRERMSDESPERVAPCDVQRNEARDLLKWALDSLDDDKRSVLLL